ncbi:MAG: hypothetical protein BZY75_04620 [SAR202 cluster bacterium Io17-Chloro-G7]|nr:MAG: hypothetical protein BZY75_04620 [SAR202 cluster bacterium Io17-Chloro-G7]
MATSIVMPQMGYDMQEGTVLKWHKKEGDEVARGDIIAEIETDKATVEYEAFTSGVLRKIIAVEGVVIPVGDLIAVIGTADEDLPDDLMGSSSATPQPASAPAPAAQATATADAPETAPTADGEVRASPIARRLARERGIELAKIPGTGPGGRIVEEDVNNYQQPAPAPAVDGAAPLQDERVELSRMRKTIAKVTSDSKRDAPHFYVTAEIDMTKAMDLRREINDNIGSQARVSVNDLIIKASAISLGRYPKFNASFRGDYLQMNGSINIGIAIALEAGLMVPGINGCGSKSLLEIAAASTDLITRANSGALRNEEYSGTTFSISNLGMFDVESFVAIIYPPHAAVVAVGTVKEQPVARDGQVVLAQIMKATLSVDHRVADGAEAAQFLMEVKNLLENPISLVI